MTAESVKRPVPECDPDLKADGWIAMGDRHIFWMHPPSQRCVTLEPSSRGECQVPCWGPDPTDPNAPGYFVVCRVHDEGGDPLFGDAFWIEDYALGLRLARRIREDILNERPSDQEANRVEYDRRKGEAWGQILKLARMNRHLFAEPTAEAPTVAGGP